MSAVAGEIAKKPQSDTVARTMLVRKALRMAFSLVDLNDYPISKFRALRQRG